MVEKDFDSVYASKYGSVVGIDEVGRGALAGPVVAAAIVLNEWIDGIDDSKKLSRKRREAIFEKLLLNSRISFGMATPTEVDLYNVIGATKLAMERAYWGLGINAFALVDGLEIGLSFFHKCIVRGDAKSPSIAAASIAAKVFRDEIMRKVSKHFNAYGFEHNVGYATAEHLQAIKKSGPTLFHRLTYQPVKESLSDELLEEWITHGKLSPQRLRNENFQLFPN